MTPETNQLVHVGDNVVVIVRGYAKGQYQLGIDAPLYVPIERDKVRQKRMEEEAK